MPEGDPILAARTRGSRSLIVPGRAHAFAIGFWLSLAIILIHALAPSATPWRRNYGSAFNGFTRDVSLGPSRATPIEKDQRGRERRDDRGSFVGGRLAGAALLPYRIEPIIAAGGARFHPARIDTPPGARIFHRLRAREPPSI